MNKDAFMNLTELLSEMQIELIRHEWSADIYERIEQADKFRGRMFDAICAFRDQCAPRVTP